MNISLSQRHRQYHLQRKLEMLDNVVNNVQKEQKSRLLICVHLMFDWVEGGGGR